MEESFECLLASLYDDGEQFSEFGDEQGGEEPVPGESVQEGETAEEEAPEEEDEEEEEGGTETES